VSRSNKNKGRAGDRWQPKRTVEFGVDFYVESRQKGSRLLRVLIALQLHPGTNCTNMEIGTGKPL
jgi:hypothetical protein